MQLQASIPATLVTRRLYVFIYKAIGFNVKLVLSITTKLS